MKVSEVVIGDTVITIVPTSHVEKDSGRLVNKTIEDIDPNIVAIELCKPRFNALKERHQNDEQEHVFKEERNASISDLLSLVRKPRQLLGFIVLFVSYLLQNTMKKFNGLNRGDSDMETALSTSEKNNTQVALIDQEMGFTINKLIRRISIREGLRLIFSMIKSVFLLIYKMIKYRNDKSSMTDNKKLSSEIDKLEKNYPTTYNTFIAERNRHMVEKLRWIASEKPTLSEETDDEEEYRIVTVIGAGHQKGMEEMLSNTTHGDGMRSDVDVLPPNLLSDFNSNQ